MSLASPDTTNNQAEYVGDLEGLRAAHEHSWVPLDVVGDSQLILRQLSKDHTPRNERVSQLYAHARRLGDLLGVRRWIHHLRGFNKMADAAANVAMDIAALTHREPGLTSKPWQSTPQAVRRSSELFAQDSPALELPSSPIPRDTHVLFFDSGSRGNPGPGGSSTCVLESTTLAVLPPWFTCGASSPWPNLEVIGDSALILRQFRDYRPPKNPRLLRLYNQARRLADQVGVRHWSHQPQAHNKISDMLANLAMDSRTSSKQPRQPLQLLANSPTLPSRKPLRQQVDRSAEVDTG